MWNRESVGILSCQIFLRSCYVRTYVHTLDTYGLFEESWFTQ